ncbi:MAG: hypothetical protein Q7R96_02790 [Nanoarchaeota archaeon]|nr:hypothetical protein [Nanoarchaeota archaeon]
MTVGIEGVAGVELRIAMLASRKTHNIDFLVNAQHEDKHLAIAEAFAHANEHEKYDLTRDLLEVWIEGYSEGSDIFGRVHPEKKRIPLVATLTGKGNELRFWIDQPGSVGMDHCDANGRLYLASITTESGEPVRDCYKELATHLLGSPLKLPNKALVFTKGTETNRPIHYTFDRHDHCLIDYQEKRVS